MHVITLLNEKGGVGKTRLAIHTAAGLARKGYKVIIIDGDAQGHATISLGLKKQSGLYDLVVKLYQWKKILRTPKLITWTEAGNPEGWLRVVPSNIETRGIPNNTGDVFALNKRLTELDDIMKGQVDYVIIDTAPTPSLLHAQIYMATDYFIFPSQCNDLSLDGLRQSQYHMQQFQGFRTMQGKPEAELIGIVPTRYDKRKIAQQVMLEEIQTNFPNKVLPPIADRTIWDETGISKKTLFTYDLKNIATKEMWAIVDYVEEFTQNEQTRQAQTRL